MQTYIGATQLNPLYMITTAISRYIKLFHAIFVQICLALYVPISSYTWPVAPPFPLPSEPPLRGPKKLTVCRCHNQESWTCFLMRATPNLLKALNDCGLFHSHRNFFPNERQAIQQVTSREGVFRSPSLEGSCRPVLPNPTKSAGNDPRTPVSTEPVQNKGVPLHR